MKILLTGASGFIGSAVLCHLLMLPAYTVSVAGRKPSAGLSLEVEQFIFDDLAIDTDFSASLPAVHVVAHCAARVHVMHEDIVDPLTEFRKVNVEGTLNLARQAAAAGVKRFIFLSSIKVNGEGTEPECPYRENDQAVPLDPYGVSKHEAEQGLLALAAETGMEIVIIRPVLVYGPGVKANFRSMMNWLNRGVPLPFGAIHNKRSLVALDNLVDLIVTCMDHPAAANQVFLVSDGDDLSTTDLLRRMGTALVKTARLIPVPSKWLEFGARLLGKQALAQRLCGSLQVDISKTREVLNWAPPVSVDEALRKTAEYFIEQQSK